MGLISRVFHGRSYELREFIEGACEVKLHFQDDGFPDENDEFWIEGGSLIWTASVRFPKECLKDFEQMLQGILGDA